MPNHLSNSFRKKHLLCTAYKEMEKGVPAQSRSMPELPRATISGGQL
jgi:hypothetical protein